MLTLKFPIAFLLCIDSSNHDTLLHMQQLCMHRLLSKMQLERKLIAARIINQSEDFNDVCAWNHITCTDGLVYRMHWSSPNVRIGMLFKNGDHRPGRIKLEWLPSTLQVVHINAQALHGTLEAKRLPRQLNDLNLRVNFLKGTIDCTSFPDGLQICVLSLNCLTGKIDLTALPKDLHTLELIGNEFSGVLLRNASLPESLEIIRVTRYSRKLRVEEVDGCAPCSRLKIDEGGKKRVIGRVREELI